MARPRANYTDEQWQGCEAAWRAGVMTVRAMEAKFSIPFGTFRDRFKGIPRDAGDAKRAIVSAAASGNPVESMARQAVVAAAMTDIDVMNKAARGAAEVIRRFESEAQTLPMAVILSVTSAAKNAMEIYRKARELEAPNEEPRKARIEFVDPR